VETKQTGKHHGGVTQGEKERKKQFPLGGPAYRVIRRRTGMRRLVGSAGKRATNPPQRDTKARRKRNPPQEDHSGNKQPREGVKILEKSARSSTDCSATKEVVQRREASIQAAVMYENEAGTGGKNQSAWPCRVLYRRRKRTLSKKHEVSKETTVTGVGV